MSKTLWHTIKLEVPKEMVNITKNDKVVVKKTLTKTNNISKANKEPSIKIIPGDTNKPKIISDGKEWNIEELKLKMKKSNLDKSCIYPCSLYPKNSSSCKLYTYRHARTSHTQFA